MLAKNLFSRKQKPVLHYSASSNRYRLHLFCITCVHFLYAYFQNLSKCPLAASCRARAGYDFSDTRSAGIRGSHHPDIMAPWIRDRAGSHRTTYTTVHRTAPALRLAFLMMTHQFLDGITRWRRSGYPYPVYRYVCGVGGGYDPSSRDRIREGIIPVPSITEVPWVMGLLFWDIDSKRKILEFLTRPKKLFSIFLSRPKYWNFYCTRWFWHTCSHLAAFGWMTWQMSNIKN